ncbi:MFS transporter [Mucilaginibacter myungsuensis]|uniref:MFS transporter n=1 Tax=Mucilaginibacter myungsuensis TaxID=649104 RepID=A0A929L1N2_9SPHI|nr:MFS transporter [Mucilaginibacter myungsuensis]MBE9662849.1 MFS transporter [Mucilaginibacter myungsuensis]MDN3598269.1 MFS transporter [Mucilaginibacter myungsuensis]
MSTIQRDQLFRASCLSLLVTSLSFGIRAGMLDKLGVDFQLDKAQLASIASVAFLGFPIAVVIGGFIVDIIGMKKLLVLAFLLHLAGIILTIFAGGYWTLMISTLCIGLANGTVEAACNPLVASLYTTEKTTKLTHFHLWFPGGIVIGSLIVLLFDKLGLSWQIQVGVMLLPTVIYGYLFSKLDFPVTERVAAGVSTAGMYKALANPLFIFMFILMFGTAITELFTGQWIGVLLKNVTENAILLLALTNGVIVLGRAFAKPILRAITPQALLFVSAVLSAMGLYMLGHFEGTAVFAGAVIFGAGVCFFWPTMLGFVNTNIPATGALGLNLMGGAGMFAVSVYTIFMGDFYKSLEASASSPIEAGRAILNATLVIPVVLIVAFGALVLFMKSRNKAEPLAEVTV